MLLSFHRGSNGATWAQNNAVLLTKFFLMVQSIRLIAALDFNWQNNDDSSASETINASKNTKSIVENVINVLIIIA